MLHPEDDGLMPALSSISESVYEIALEAGRRIMSFYDRDPDAAPKGNSSAVSDARLAAHYYLSESLTPLLLDTPVISGQTDESLWEFLPKAPRYWLVDPMDGTTEFIHRTDEFTINVALVERGQPVLGVVHAPATGVTYVATTSGGAWHARAGLPLARISTRLAHIAHLGVVASKDHAGPLVGALLEHVQQETILWMASSLKYCLVAEGRADICLGELPSLEWETAAAQCVVEAAGGLFCLLDGKPLTYGKAGFKNPPVVAVGDWQLDWQPLVFGI
jgi:3'(2'), 5'-bisphosphate nucleotidase